MTPETLRLYCKKYGINTIAEAICKKRRLVEYMLAGKRTITESTHKLLTLSFPEGV